MKQSNVLMMSLMVALVGCGNDEGAAQSMGNQPNKVNENKSIQEETKVNSKLSKHMSIDGVCQLMSVEEVKNMFSITAEVKATPSEYRGEVSCQYNWDREDAIDRMKVLTSGQKLPRRQTAPNGELRIALSESKRSKDNFVPATLSEEQLNARIEAAQKAANDRLTDEQKAVAGDMAGDMVASMLRKNNQNQEIEGLADAAYWSKVGMGGLFVLDGNIQVYVSPMIADDESTDIDNAKKVVEVILK